MNTSDIAPWLAGLFEGEGSVILSNRSNGVRLALSMTDKDVVERILSVTQKGTVKHRPYVHKKDQWVWTVCSKNDVQEILELILPYMGERRTAKIQEAFAQLEKNRGFYQPIQHGTRKGYRAEVSRGIEPCEACIVGNKEADKARNQKYYEKRGT